MKKLGLILLFALVTTILSSCLATNDYMAYYSGNWDDKTADQVVFEENSFEDVTVDEMLPVFQGSYGWTDLVGQRLLWDGNTILVKFTFSDEAKYWQIDAARAYALKELNLGSINNYSPNPYGLWLIGGLTQTKPKVCAEIYIGEKLLLQDIYEGIEVHRYENMEYHAEVRLTDPEWSESLNNFINKTIRSDKIVFQRSLLGKAIVIQVYSDKAFDPKDTEAIQNFIQVEIAPNALRDNKIDTENDGLYPLIVLELYASEVKYYNAVCSNLNKLPSWVQIDWMNDAP